MRTKALLGLAVLSASAATCLAQNVYSLNIVGYVNVTIPAGTPQKPGLALIANPLKPSNANYNITNTIVLGAGQDNAQIFTWAGTGWSSDTPQWYWLGDHGEWSPEATIDLGSAFFIANPGSAGTVTFVGEVATGDISYALPAGISVVAPKTPVEQAWPGRDVGNDGDLIFTWAGTGWSAANYQYYADTQNPANSSWYADGVATPENGPVVKVGEGVVYQNTKTALAWVRQFNP
jgi:hypothetical protein